MVDLARKARIVALLTLAAIAASIGPARMVSAADAQNEVARLEPIEKKIFQLVNQARQSEGLALLRWNDRLAEAAAGHLARMMQKRSLSHQFPGEVELTGRIAATGQRFVTSGENVAFSTEWEDLHPGLMRSPGHRANILSPNFNQLGIAVSLGPDGYYAVQDFAHTTIEASSDEAEVRWATALRLDLRRQIPVKYNPRIREAACEMAARDQVDARRIPLESLQGRIFAYTTSEPEDLPQKVLDAARASNVKEVELGICYRATEKNPGGTYWVGVVY